MSALSSLIDRYASGGAVLVYAVTNLTPEQEQARPGPGAWSIAELAAHLVDSDVLAGDRMKFVIAQPDPILVGMDETAWVSRLRSAEIRCVPFVFPVPGTAALFCGAGPPESA